MKSPAIIDPASIAATSRQPALQFEAAPDVPFNHVLSREMASRNEPAPAPAAAATPQPTTQASAAPAAQSAPPATQSTQSAPAAKGTDKADGKDKADKQVDGKDKDAKDAADSTDQTDPASLLALVANIGQLTGNANAKATPADDKAGADLGKDSVARKVDLKAVRDASRPDAAQAGDSKVQADDKGVDFAGELKRSSDAREQVAGAVDTARQPAQAAAEVIAADAVAKQMEAGNLPAAASAQATAALTAAQQAAQTALRAAPGHASDIIAPKVGTPGWDQAVGQRVVWMVAGAEQSASLTLNPPDLGPLQVVLNVSNSTANATFVAAQPEVRQALEAAMPRLRDMLGDAGIQLGQATVSSGMQQNQGDAQAQASQRSFGASGNARSDVADTQIHVSRGRAVSAGNGLVDTFV
jgi:flagellar hook-length control protein FliK